MKKKIKFYASLPDVNLPEPGPSSRRVPDWYRKMDGVVDGMETIKKCMPILDAFMSGYTITSSVDVHFDDDGVIHNSSIPIVETHDKKQLQGFNVPEEYFDQPFKWVNHFSIKTPKGYSTLFVHPLNQIDLPFYSLGGIVDTDKYPAPVNFPFFIKKNFSGIIKADTPIIQAIPFKRDDWSSSIDEMSPGHIPLEFESERMSPPFNFYKRKYWFKKKYT